MGQYNFTDPKHISFFLIQKTCPAVVHDLMLSCWNKNRTERPLFSIIREGLDSWIKHPDLLDGVAVIGL